MDQDDVIETGRYEHDGEFWSAQVKGRFLTIYSGKIGTRGYHASREFRSHEAARQFMEQKLEKRISEGYVRRDESD
ncbi:MAG: WGR domain-containing protein [Candidatus Thorarchaeota archaeon]|nr:WGR domain-containing protein [Candidatus Thorarchaeota archaeon]